jgi:hypothetical protein
VTAEGEIANVIGLFVHLLDDGRFDGLGQLLTEDAVLEVSGYTITGRDKVVRAAARSQPSRAGRHFVGSPVISLKDEDHALSWTDMMVVLPAVSGFEITYIGRYYDQFLRNIGDGRWRIFYRALVAAGEAPPAAAESELRPFSPRGQ